MSIQPRSGVVYTLRQVLTQLELRDSPHLGFRAKPPAAREFDIWRPADHIQWHEGRAVIQESHCTTAQMLEVPGFADSLWRYVRETHEWIPVFEYAGTAPITDFVDMEPENEKYADDMQPRGWWVTPKGLTREQYYGVYQVDTVERGLNNTITVVESSADDARAHVQRDGLEIVAVRKVA